MTRTHRLSPAERRVRACAAAVLVAVASVWGLPIAASAHAELASSSPAAYSTITQAPADVVLNFNETMSQIGKNVISVTSPTGAEMVSGSTATSANVVQAHLRPFTAEGAYTVAFRVVSGDGHVVSDSFAFNFYKTMPTAAASAAHTAPAMKTLPPSGDQPDGGQGVGAVATPSVSQSIQVGQPTAPAKPAQTRPTLTKWLIVGVFAGLLYVANRAARKYRRKRMGE